MPHHATASLKSFAPTGRAARGASVALLALMVAACGGGADSTLTTTPPAPTPAPAGSPTPTPSPTPSPTSVAVDVVNQVTDATGAALSGATVTLTTSGLSVPLIATSDAQGQYTLKADVEAAALPTTAPVLVTITKAGYETQVVELTVSQLTGGSVSTATPVVLQATDPTELVPAAGVNVTRVGDNKAPTDEINKYMQTASVGLSTAFQLGSIAPLADGSGNLSGYPTMTLSMSFRALQASGCPTDEVRVYQQATTSDATQVTIQRFKSSGTTMALIDSNVNGSLTLFQPSISTALMKASQGPLWIEVKSGLCYVGEYDDFEFVNVHAKFNAGP